MKASMGLTRMMHQETKAVEMMHHTRKTLLTQGFKTVYGTDEMVFSAADYSKLEQRITPTYTSTPEKRAEIAQSLRDITGAK